MKWKPIVALGGVVEHSGKERIPGRLSLTSTDGEVNVKVSLPYDPAQSVQSVREDAVARAIEVLQRVASDLAASSPREIEEEDRATLHRDPFDNPAEE